MKTVFDKSTRDELISRINLLHEDSKSQWGKMNVYQMVKHCRLWEEMALGRVPFKRSLIGRIFGKIALKDLTKDDNPLRRNTPTSPEFKITDNNGDLASERKKWISLLEGHAHYSSDDFLHPFFGKVTREQTGYLSYKHTDHHLRQFGA